MRARVRFSVAFAWLCGCNFSFDPTSVPASEHEADASSDGGSDADEESFDGALRELPEWCRDHCLGPGAGSNAICDSVRCADAAVCVDRTPCELCRLCPEWEDPEAGAAH